MSAYAKAIAGALTALLVYVISAVGLELPAGAVASLETLVTGAVVWWVRNHPEASNGA